jgi:Flp pilus assembly protein TadD
MLNPKDATAYYNRGVSYGRTGEQEKAMSDFTMAIKLRPKYAKAYYNRGVIYDEKGQRKKAESDFRNARELGLE